MIKVIAPNNFQPERLYIVEELFSFIIQGAVNVQFSDELSGYYLLIFGEKEIKIKDFFFDLIAEKSYLNQRNLPKNIEWFKSNLYLDSFPIIYGQNILTINENSIETFVDIFASSFFMLSRWEEVVVNSKDDHNRFHSSDAVAVKNGFNSVPVVNYYIDFLKNLLERLGFNGNDFIRHSYRELYTCDVDSPWDPNFKSYPLFLKSLAGDFVKRKKFKIGFSRLGLFAKNLISKRKYDPHFTFDYIENEVKKRNIDSVYYYIADTPAGKLDTHYKICDRAIYDLIEKQIKSGNKVGLHGSYLSYNDGNQLNKEYFLLQNLLRDISDNYNLLETRQHYLRWDTKLTPGILNELGLTNDSSLYFPAAPGFRSGICMDYRLFDLKNRKTLTLKERPLIFMEASILDNWYLGEMTGQEKLNLVKSLKDEVKKFSGQFVLLWHNSRLITKGDRNLFETILDI